MGVAPLSHLEVINLTCLAQFTEADLGMKTIKEYAQDFTFLLRYAKQNKEINSSQCLKLILEATKELH